MLKSLGVDLDGPMLMLWDKLSVILNTSVPSSVLKRQNAIVYIQEAIADKVMSFAYLRSEENVSDVLTKPLSNEMFCHLMKRLLFLVPDVSK